MVKDTESLETAAQSFYEGRYFSALLSVGEVGDRKLKDALEELTDCFDDLVSSGIAETPTSDPNWQFADKRLSEYRVG